MTRVVVGRIVKPIGVRGEVAVVPTGEDPERFACGERLFVEPVGEEALQIRLSRIRNSQVTVAFEGIEDRNGAEELVGIVLHQDVDKLPALPEGTYYHFQLVGLTAVREDGTVLGDVVRVHELPASDVLEIRGGEHEWMVPRMDQFVASIDLEAGKIVLSATDDLLEAVGQVRTGKESPGKIRRRAREEARQRAREIRDEQREEKRKAEERAAAERESRELDVTEWNARRAKATGQSESGSRGDDSD